MIANDTEVRVFIEHSVVCIQEKVKGVLVEEVHLEEIKIPNITTEGLFCWFKRASEVERECVQTWLRASIVK